jgi:hypothetical protein
MRQALSLCFLTAFAAALTAQTPRVVVLDMLLDNSVV